jgi:hypothetical protein
VAIINIRDVAITQPSKLIPRLLTSELFFSFPTFAEKTLTLILAEIEKPRAEVESASGAELSK